MWVSSNISAVYRFTMPIYDIEAAAGSGRLSDAENIESTLYFETAQLEAEGLEPAQIVGPKVRGDSMEETPRDGDLVLVDRSQRTPDGVFLLRMGDELRIKHVQRVAMGR
ncbi:S24 family peptidase [Halomonas sp. McH1-25]|uniref:S24 family peptidase n=1 Tax=unclassified Halomonas TaxID=2609666 RepID=UPI001EF4EA09|nr:MULTISPECIES: S24 family peptidase [unclassified Halomonas]MCG7599715.1 S24 family peptidase [Halomonas sp. McH1-25]MCP1342799.1 S24 family peptidase [Halomonas sp. FL8]MCP1360869.1 S24 family peptidase [Halomonas sp. BBD45]MCP1365056.1 S24 family peptidase [Halomonas sp. BBD48]